MTRFPDKNSSKEDAILNLGARFFRSNSGKKVKRCSSSTVLRVTSRGAFLDSKRQDLLVKNIKNGKNALEVGFHETA